MPEVFKYKGEYVSSSKIPTIEGKPREEFWKQLIAEAIAGIPPVKEGEKRVYVATGGGYGSFDKLIEFEKQTKSFRPTLSP